MVDYNSPLLNDAFHAMADPTRRAILLQIAKKERTVSELAEPFHISLAAVSKHVQVLERARLVKKVKDGRDVTCQLNAEPLGEMLEIIQAFQAFWTKQLDALEQYFIKENEKQGGSYGNKEGGSPTKSRSQKNHSGKTRKSI
jgi:DNA-binding transcriptional ArsR family regulator